MHQLAGNGHHLTIFALQSTATISQDMFKGDQQSLSRKMVSGIESGLIEWQSSSSSYSLLKC